MKGSNKMPTRKVQRLELEHYLNTGTSIPIWSRIGEGHAALSVSYNAEEETEQWINQSTGSTYVKTYAPTIDTEQTAFVGDPIFDFVDDIAFRMKVLSDAETDYLEVRSYTNGTVNARKFRVSISVGSEGDAAVDPMSRAYKINFMGDPIFGSFSGGTFTPEV